MVASLQDHMLSRTLWMRQGTDLGCVTRNELSVECKNFVCMCVHVCTVLSYNGRTSVQTFHSVQRSVCVIRSEACLHMWTDGVSHMLSCQQGMDV